MRPDRFTLKTQEALNSAVESAAQHDHSEVSDEHLLLALLGQSEGLTRPVLEKLGADPRALETRLEAELGRRAKIHGGAQPQLGSDLRKTLEAAEREMTQLKDEYLSAEHVLLALAGGNSAAARALKEAGVTHAKLMQALAQIRGSQRVTDQEPEGK